MRDAAAFWRTDARSRERRMLDGKDADENGEVQGLEPIPSNSALTEGLPAVTRLSDGAMRRLRPCSSVFPT